MGYNGAQREMKKALFIVTLALVGVFAASCNKVKTCKCNEYYEGQIVDYEIGDPTEYGVKTCDALTNELNYLEGGDGWSYKCEKY